MPSRSVSAMRAQSRFERALVVLERELRRAHVRFDQIPQVARASGPDRHRDLATRPGVLRRPPISTSIVIPSGMPLRSMRSSLSNPAARCRRDRPSCTTAASAASSHRGESGTSARLAPHSPRETSVGSGIGVPSRARARGTAVVEFGIADSGSVMASTLGPARVNPCHECATPHVSTVLWPAHRLRPSAFSFATLFFSAERFPGRIDSDGR